MAEIGENPEREARKRTLTDALQEAATGGEAGPIDLDDAEDDDVVAVTDSSRIPDWAAVPADFRMPDGWVIYFIRFRAAWTNTPRKGDRVAILWNLSESDEKLAAKRARGDGLRLIEEMAKQMIRAIDGGRADWGGAPGPQNVHEFWSEIGGKCRYLLKSHYLKTHTLSPDETLDFFEHCVTSRSAG